jgi:hypothetical protein
MSGSATFVITVSITSRMAPSEAASVMAHFRTPRSSRRLAIGERYPGSDP